MDKKLTTKDTSIEDEIQNLRDGFLMLKKKRKALQEKIDAFKKNNS